MNINNKTHVAKIIFSVKILRRISVVVAVVGVVVFSVAMMLFVFCKFTCKYAYCLIFSFTFVTQI